MINKISETSEAHLDEVRQRLQLKRAHKALRKTYKIRKETYEMADRQDTEYYDN